MSRCGLVVVAPPELRTITRHRFLRTVSFDVPFALAVLADPVTAGTAEDDSGFDSDADERDESDAEGLSAHATAGVVATAPPTPRATARAPRYLANEIVTGPGFLCRPAEKCFRCSRIDIMAPPSAVVVTAEMAFGGYYLTSVDS
ncbi:MAG TPA: hypothetical protein VFK56_17785 [Mycobacterium sp.]|nr:hypothetical protein [Mycobacterium sp.]